MRLICPLILGILLSVTEQMQRVQCNYALSDDYTPEYDFQDTLGSTHSEHEEHFLVEETELNPSECVETYLHPRQYIEQHETISFSKVSSAWSERQYTLAMKTLVERNVRRRVLRFLIIKVSWCVSTKAKPKEHCKKIWTHSQMLK